MALEYSHGQSRYILETSLKHLTLEMEDSSDCVGNNINILAQSRHFIMDYVNGVYLSLNSLIEVINKPDMIK